MKGVIKNKMKITTLEKRLMLDASLGALISSTVFAENTVNATPQVIDSDVSISGTTTDFTGEDLTISTTGGAENQLTIADEGTGAGEIGFNGANITYSGTIIGTLSSNGANGNDLIVSLNANASQAGIERLIENITYQNTSDNPTTNHTANIALGALFSEDITITVVAQNDAPVSATNIGLTLNEGASGTITITELNITDGDDTHSDVIFTITSALSNGQLELTTNTGVAITSFTRDDLVNNRVQYVHDDTETTSDSFDFTVTDGDAALAADTFSITVTPVDDIPTIDTNTGTTVFQNLSTTIGGSGSTNTVLVTNDFDTAPSNITYTIATDVANGTLYNNGVALGLNDTFTQSDLDLSLVTYTNAGGTSDSFDFSVTDGTTVIAGQTFAITVDTSNVAPEILTTITILDEDFEGGTTGWNNNTTTTDTVLSEYWGEFANNIHVTGDQELYQTFATSGTQDYIVVEFDFYEIDGWDNEYFYIFVNDTNILGTSHRLQMNTFDSEADGVSGDVTYSVQETTEALGYITQTAIGYDQTYHYTLIIENSDPTLKLGFGTSLNSNINDESFGIDNLQITEAGQGNADAQEFYITEDIANGESVGTVQAADDNAGQDITYSATGGTGNGLFSINTDTGEITVTDNSTFDYESTTSYTLDIAVTDGALTGTQTITINMLDVMENELPTFTGTGPFIIGEDAAVNDDVGTVTTTDADGDNVTYSITSGNTNSAFKIDATTGLIEVNSAVLDYDTDSSYTLSIRATDNNDLSRFRNQSVTINISDIDEAPILDIGGVIEAQNSGVIYSADTGNFYLVEGTNFSYANALANAETELLNGVAGHLVTITTQAEFEFIRDEASPSHVWLALSDEGEEGKWIWTAGPEAGTQIVDNNNSYVTGWYENWQGSEPNSGDTRNWALMHSNSLWYDNWVSNYDSVIEWEGADIINNSYYNVNHTNADASDVSNGDSVGFVRGLDPEGDALDFTIQAGNGDGIFEIDTATGEIRILDTTNLDATLNDTYTLTIRATENAGTKFDEIDITIKFNDDLWISANNALTLDEGASAVLTTADLNISDLDGVAADTVFRTTTLAANGQLEHSDNPGFQISSFTLEDLQNGNISYVHDGTETTNDIFTFQVTDGGNTITGQTFNITIGDINDAPTIATNTGTTVIEGANATIDNTMLDALEIDDTATGLTYTASSLTGGLIQVNGVTQNTFTQDDIDNNLVIFIHDGSEAAAASFAFSLADGGEDSAAPATGTFNLTVTPVNDSPTITTNTGASVIEGDTVTVTTSMINATDPDDSGTGLTYTLSNINNGQVELSTNSGVPIISFTQDDLDNNRVVFRHDGGESDAQFDISLADGGEDSATTDSATFSLTRTPVNDSPIVGTNTGTSVNQNSIVILKNSVLAASDPDDSGIGLTFTITGTTNGQLEYLANSNVAITTFTQADIDSSLVVFRHSGPPGVADFDFSITDGGEDSSVAATGTFDLTVDNTNDAPTIATNTGPTIDEGSTTTITTAMLDSFDPDDFGTDLTWTASGLVNGIIQVNGATQNTFTQSDLDNGLVTFIHDDTETTTAGFDIQVADGGEDSASPDTGTFTMTVTPVNEASTLIVNDGSPNVIDFNDYSVETFDPSQDGATSETISADGSTLEIGPNSWKKIDIPYTLTANTVLSFEFRADDVSEILGIGFDDDNTISDGVNGYQLGGTQTWSGMDQSFNTYDPGDGWVRFDIPIGADFTGTMNSMIFVLDDDASPTGTALFRNVNFYENNQTVDVNEGGTFNITNAHINSTDLDDSGAGLTFTVSSLSNGVTQVSGVTQTTFTQDDIDNNRVTFVHDGSETANASFDISLADGGEDSVSPDTGSFTLIVNPLNDAATIGANTGATMNEGANLTITTAMLNEGDPDDDGAQLTYTASSLTNGHIEVNGTTQTTFTQDDIDNDLVEFVHDGTETTTASLALSLVDGGEDSATADTGTFNITITSVNDASTITTNTGGTLNEGTTATITNTQLVATDSDNTDSSLTFTITTLSAGLVENTNTTSTLIIGDTFTQGDIDSGFIRYAHDGGEATSQTLSLTVDDGEITSAAFDFVWVVTPVNDAPTEVLITASGISEDSSIGAAIGTLYATDVDLPGDSFTYTIMNDPDNMFLIFGSELRVSGAMDFETAAFHEVTIRADDGNGGTVNTIMTINVTDVNESTFTPLPSISTDPTGFNGVVIEEEEQEQDLSNKSNLLQTYLSGNSFAQMQAFYGDDGIGQILRQNTTFQIQDIMNGQPEAEQEDLIQSTVELETSSTHEPLTTEEKFTNIRELLLAMEEFENDNGEDGENEDDVKQFYNLNTQFEDVLTYHEQRKEKLRDALGA